MFTAELSALDYDQLVKDGGCVQLWSDIFRQDENAIAWQAVDFEDSASRFTTALLVDNSPSQKTSVKILSLSISLPLSNNTIRQFSFTYRIAYSSGDITWLGAFGQDGVLTLNQSHSDPFGGIHLHAGWTSGPVQHCRVIEIKDVVNSLEVAIMDNLSEYRVCALGSNRLVLKLKVSKPCAHIFFYRLEPHPRNVSLLFFIPLCQRHSLVLSPTIIVAASPGLSLSFVDDQYLTMTGSGVTFLQICDLQTDITTFAERILSHAKLDEWELLSTDTKGRSIALASTRQQPIDVVTIPLWPSKYTNTNVYLNCRQLVDLYTTRDINEFALLLPHTNELHVFSKEHSDGHDILIQNGSTGGNFTIFPIYRMPTGADKPNMQLQRNWGTAILSPYNKLSTNLALTDNPRIYSTAPETRHYEPTFSPLTRASSETMLSSITSFPSHAAKPCNEANTCANHADELESVCTDDDHFMLSPTAPNQPSTPQSILSLFKSIFVSVKTIIHFFFRFYWDSLFPFRAYQTRQLLRFKECDDRQIQPSTNLLIEKQVSPVSPPVKGYSSLPSISENRVQITQGTGAPTEVYGDISQDTDSGPFPDIKSTKSLDTTIENTFASGDLGLLAQSTSEGKTFYAEVSSNQGFGQATTAIILLPPILDDVDKEVISTPSFANEDLQRAVAFFDDSDPRCTIRKVKLFNCDSSGQPQQIEDGGKNICYLLEYQLDQMDGELVKKISISPPGSGGRSF